MLKEITTVHFEYHIKHVKTSINKMHYFSD